MTFKDSLTGLNEVSVKSVNCGEIVGGNGRIGSFLYRQSGSISSEKESISSSLYRLTRDEITGNQNTLVTIGLHSPPGTPIYVATPASAIPELVKKTHPERREDLVFVCNGLVSKVLSSIGIISANEVTIVVPHFAVLKVNADPVGIRVPSVVFGKHAKNVSILFASAGLPVSIVKTVEQINLASSKKLLWASLMWLLTRDFDDDRPQYSVGQIYSDQKLKEKLELIVSEMLPAVQYMAIEGSNTTLSNVPLKLKSVMEYLETYSLSIPEARPSLDLGLNEFNERNGQFLLLDNVFHQPLHKELLRRVLGNESFAQCENTIVQMRTIIC